MGVDCIISAVFKESRGGLGGGVGGCSPDDWLVKLEEGEDDEEEDFCFSERSMGRSETRGLRLPRWLCLSREVLLSGFTVCLRDIECPYERKLATSHRRDTNSRTPIDELCPSDREPRCSTRYAW